MNPFSLAGSTRKVTGWDAVAPVVFQENSMKFPDIQNFTMKFTFNNLFVSFGNIGG